MCSPDNRKVDQLSEKSTHISIEDKLRLHRYFGGNIEGTDRSNTSAQLEWLGRRNRPRFKCPVCDGDGMIYCGGARAKTCPRCSGAGEVELSQKGIKIPRTGYARCDRCHGAVDWDTACEFCHGAGFASMQVAFCLHEDEAVAYADADEDSFEERDEMRLRLDQSVELKIVADRYYGTEGNRWERQKRGRLFSLFDLTPAGKELLRRSPKIHQRNCTRLERIGILFDSNSRFPKADVTELIANALLQADALFEQFEAEWTGAPGGHQ